MESQQLMSFLNTCMILSLIITFGLLINRIICINEKQPSEDTISFLYKKCQEKNQEILILLGVCFFLFLNWIRAMV